MASEWTRELRHDRCAGLSCNDWARLGQPARAPTVAVGRCSVSRGLKAALRRRIPQGSAITSSRRALA